jgi:methylenetetrahydrofolate reductase (NADPH)
VTRELPTPFCYELLPFPSAEAAALAVPPSTLTVTCSPKHGPDHTVAAATRLAALGHTVIAHLAARMVRDRGHLHELLEQMHDGGVRDAFVIGGDAPAALGPYRCARDLLADLRAHVHPPRSVGVAAYPEGHPLIDAAVLSEDLLAKAQAADYMTTQLCFDAAALERWLEQTRAAGIGLPAYVGLPGALDRRRLLEISLRVGVGTSVSFLRKQPDARRLLRGGDSAVAALYDAVIPQIGVRLGIAGVHFFTFNRLAETVQLAERSRDRLLLHAIGQEPHRT